MYDFSVYEEAYGQEISECGVSGDIVQKLTKTLPVAYLKLKNY